MSHSTRRFAVTATLLLAFPAHAFATEYYVAPTGNDTHDGSMSSPWATLQHAADMVRAGDTVHVADGDYVGFDMRTPGSASQPITFVGDGSNARITTRNGVTPDGINVEEADYVTIDNFVANALPRAGVRCAESTHVTIRRIHADMNARWGILTGCCESLVIEDNVTSHSVAEHGIYVGNSGDDPVIRRNISFGNHANGIHMNGDASITCTRGSSDGVISRALVERNVIYSNGSGGGSGINCDGVSDSVIQDNLIYDALASGISLYQIDAATGAQRNLIVNNTILQSATGRWAINIGADSGGNILRNNILFTAHSFRGVISVDSSSLAGFSSDYNVLQPRFTTDDANTILDLAAWQAMGYDTHSVASMPSANFVDSAANDYHLVATAPAVDRGEAMRAPAYDLEGHVRPFGSAVDIGAYEYGSTVASDGGGMGDAAMTDVVTMTDSGPGADVIAMADAVSDVSMGADVVATTDTPIVDAGRDANASGDAASASDAQGGDSSMQRGACGCRVPGRNEARGGFAVAALLAALALRKTRRG